MLGVGDGDWETRKDEEDTSDDILNRLRRRPTLCVRPHRAGRAAREEGQKTIPSVRHRSGAYGEQRDLAESDTDQLLTSSNLIDSDDEE